jgi:acetyl-CoA C-acetyltransferase
VPGNRMKIINNAAAAAMMMSAVKATELGLTPLAMVRAYLSTGVDPSIIRMCPVGATLLFLRKASWSIKDVDLVKMNEALAAQALAVNRAVQSDGRESTSTAA